MSVYFAVFLIGLLGGVHCVGMCGGIVAALSGPQLGTPTRAAASKWALHLAYNFGRISSYTMAGVVFGLLGSASLLFNRWLPIQLGFYVFANLLLIALGLYLLGRGTLLAPLERAGHKVWTHVQPLTRRFLPVRRLGQAFPVGVLWGFLPCGMTYSVLSTALVSGSAINGGLLMFAFGLGTLPNLLLSGMLLVRYRAWVQRPWLRRASALLLIALGVYGLLRAPQLGGALWQGVVCEIPLGDVFEWKM